MTAWQGTRILCNAADYADYAVLQVTKILFNTAGDQKIIQYCRLCRWSEYHAILQNMQMLQVTKILCNTADYADAVGDQKIMQKKIRLSNSLKVLEKLKGRLKEGGGT